MGKADIHISYDLETNKAQTANGRINLLPIFWCFLNYVFAFANGHANGGTILAGISTPTFL